MIQQSSHTAAEERTLPAADSVQQQQQHARPAAGLKGVPRRCAQQHPRQHLRLGFSSNSKRRSLTTCVAYPSRGGLWGRPAGARRAASAAVSRVHIG